MRSIENNSLTFVKFSGGKNWRSVRINYLLITAKYLGKKMAFIESKGLKGLSSKISLNTHQIFIKRSTLNSRITNISSNHNLVGSQKMTQILTLVLTVNHHHPLHSLPGIEAKKEGMIRKKDQSQKTIDIDLGDQKRKGKSKTKVKETNIKEEINLRKGIVTKTNTIIRKIITKKIGKGINKKIKKKKSKKRGIEKMIKTGKEIKIRTGKEIKIRT